MFTPGHSFFVPFTSPERLQRTLSPSCEAAEAQRGRRAVLNGLKKQNPHRKHLKKTKKQKLVCTRQSQKIFPHYLLERD